MRSRGPVWCAGGEICGIAQIIGIMNLRPLRHYYQGLAKLVGEAFSISFVRSEVVKYFDPRALNTTMCQWPCSELIYVVPAPLPIFAQENQGKFTDPPRKTLHVATFILPPRLR